MSQVEKTAKVSAIAHLEKIFPYPLPTLAFDEVIGKARSQDGGIV
ncbi:MAG: hypothetical protein RID53_29985 [Coleofasciculus sp. B1-GNL1-01]